MRWHRRMSKNNVTDGNNSLDHNTQPQICEKNIWVKRSFIYYYFLKNTKYF